MSRRTYALTPQRLVTGSGYQPCEPHQACRVVIIETTAVPAKRGRRAYHIKRTVAQFRGSGMMLEARLELDRLVGRTQPASKRRTIWGRSLTLAEYNARNP